MFSISKFCISSFNRSLLSNLCQSTFFLQQRCVKSVALDSLPEKPKRPPSSWLLFIQERRQELQELAEYKDMSFTEMSTKMSEEWRKFDEVDKKPYKEKYGEFMAEYKHKMEEYKSNLTPEDKQLLFKIKKDEKQESKIFEKLYPKPKFPGNGYSTFVKSYLAETPQNTINKDMKQRIRDCASKWQSMDDETKQSLNEKAWPLITKYREEIKDWKEKYQEWKKSDTSSN